MNAEISIPNLLVKNNILNTAITGDFVAFKKIVDLDIGTLNIKSNSTGYNAYLIAAQNGFNNMVEYILSKGCDIDYIDYSKNSALHLAIECGHVDTVRLLLNEGINIDMKNDYNEDALIIAANHGHSVITKILLDHECLTTRKNLEGRTALFIAAMKGFNSIVLMLAPKDKNVNIKDNNGDTMLIKAIEGNHISVIRTLLKYGADPNLNNENLDTPLLKACENGNLKVVQMLLDRGVDLNFANNFGCYPLMAAVMADSVPIFKTLIERGAYFSNKPFFNHSIAYYAARHSNSEMLFYLEKICPGSVTKAFDTGNMTNLYMYSQTTRELMNALYELGLLETRCELPYVTPTHGSAEGGNTNFAKLNSTFEAGLRFVIDLDLDELSYTTPESLTYIPNEAVHPRIIAGFK